MDKELLEAGYRAYTGEKIDVYFNTAICQHSGNCVRGSAKLFNLKRKPWIIPDEVDVATVVKVIDTCPSCSRAICSVALCRWRHSARAISPRFVRMKICKCFVDLCESAQRF